MTKRIVSCLDSSNDLIPHPVPLLTQYWPWTSAFLPTRKRSPGVPSPSWYGLSRGITFRLIQYKSLRFLNWGAKARRWNQGMFSGSPSFLCFSANLFAKTRPRTQFSILLSPNAFQKGVLFALAAQVDSTSQFGHIHSISFDPEQHFVHMVCEGKRSAASPRSPQGPPWHIKAPQHWSFSRSEGYLVYLWSIFVQILHQSWQTGPERN